MDGVIIDSEALSVESEKYVLHKYGITVEDSDWETFKGKTSVAIFNFIINKYSIKNLTPEKMRVEKIEYYMTRFDECIRLFKGFTELIEYLRPKYKIALATSSGEDIRIRVFDKFDLHKYFDHVVTGDMVTHGKPHPEPYLLALSKLGLPGSNCVVIEDADNGINSAQAAGIKTIAVTHTFPREILLHSNFVVDDLKEIKNLI